MCLVPTPAMILVTAAYTLAEKTVQVVEQPREKQPSRSAAG
jgi:hypothetical protein